MKIVRLLNGMSVVMGVLLVVVVGYKALGWGNGNENDNGNVTDSSAS